MLRPVERVGIFGGTFDPVHVGHLAAAMAARHQLSLDRVLLVVARDPWQKSGSVAAPAELRYEMVCAALDGVAGLEPSRLELDRPGPTYTIDTVDELARPDRDLFLILGRDAATGLHTWKRVDELRAAVTLAVVEREDVGAGISVANWNTVSVALPRLDVSSSDLRRRMRAGEPVEFLVPTAAARVMREHNLYTAP
jgi:nicotinate-nucleotide adenylyltransferase